MTRASTGRRLDGTSAPICRDSRWSWRRPLPPSEFPCAARRGHGTVRRVDDASPTTGTRRTLRNPSSVDLASLPPPRLPRSCFYLLTPWNRIDEPRSAQTAYSTYVHTQKEPKYDYIRVFDLDSMSAAVVAPGVFIWGCSPGDLGTIPQLGLGAKPRRGIGAKSSRS